MQRLFGASKTDVELEHRARHAHAGELCDLRVERLGEAAAAAAHFDVSFAGERAHGGRDIGDRRAIDEMYGVAERDAKRDAGDREQEAAARPTRVEQRGEAQHPANYTARAVGCWRHSLANYRRRWMRIAPRRS